MPSTPLPRRLALGLGATLPLWPRAAPAAETAAWAALRAGGIVLFRHAIAPGGGDPAGMRLGDCTTQRNLDATGRAQARRIGVALRGQGAALRGQGAALRGQGVAVGAVLASAWCRTMETAELAFPGQVVVAPAFNSFFGNRATGPAQTEAARALLRGWAGPGALVVVTHQVNITALTGIFPASGEGIVLEVAGLEVVGRIRP